MLPRLLNESERALEPRPSLPAIRDLFGEHLARPTNKQPQFTFPPPRSSSFSLSDLGSSLPTDSRPASPSENQGWASPNTVWSQTSSFHGSARGPQTVPLSPRRHSDASSRSITSSAPSPARDQFITLPLPQKSGFSRPRDYFGHSVTAWRPTSSSRRAYESHNRARSSSAAIGERKADYLRTSLGISSRRRHTIASARGPSPVQFCPVDAMPEISTLVPSSLASAIDPSYERRVSVTNPYSPPSPSIMGVAPTLRDIRRTSPPTSGEDVSTERRRSPAKYQCQYCGKRFNRPSSLKIHHNTHTGEKPFACPFPGCGRHFSVMSNMRRHARIHGDTFLNSQPRREDSEEIPDFPYSSSSSTHTTPILPYASLSSAQSYSRSHTPSASPSPHQHIPSHLPSRSNSYRPHLYAASSSLSSDDDGSSIEH